MVSTKHLRAFRLESYTDLVPGSFGVLGYTGDGISKSLDRAVHRKTLKRILAAKVAEAEHLMQLMEIL